MIKYLRICVLLFVVYSCTQPQTDIAFNHGNLSYEGRIVYTDTAAVFSWPGTSVSMQFEGTGVSATLMDLDTANYYNVILDGKVISKIHPDTIRKAYVLASDLIHDKHTVQLFKRTEWDKGITLFYGFEIEEGGKLLSAPEPKKRKMEFYGNSITCGYGNEDYSGMDRPFGYYQNNYLTYGAITARHFNAQYHCIGKSGIGVAVSWFPMIMSEMYNRLDATDSTTLWDFHKYTPDIVVVNLFQNDSWIVTRPDNEQFRHRFGDTAPTDEYIIKKYKELINTLRSKYPNASIICALGNMDATQEGSAWPGYIASAVEQLNDSNIYTCFFPFKNTGGHPKVEEQQAMADTLIAFIEKHIDW